MPSVHLSHYSSTWPLLFQEVRTELLELMGLETPIEHIGSTAVPGLLSKPIIDVLVGVPSLGDADAAVPRLVSAGYRYIQRHEAEFPERRFLHKWEGEVRTHHIHMVAVGSEFWHRHLAFRDYLIQHPETAIEYAALKLHLAEICKTREEYTDAKGPFIRGVERLAGMK